MKLPKLLAILLIVGLSLQSAACPQLPTKATDLPTPLEGPARTSPRNGPSLQGGETNIDGFSVHPANRWNEENTGSYTETLDSGEFEWEGQIHDSATMGRYRESFTLDDTIATRWRLNATADFESNETDYATQAGLWGPDGWGFEENDNEDFSALLGTANNLVHVGGIYKIDVVGAASDLSGRNNTLVDIDTTLFSNGFSIRINASENNLRFSIFVDDSNVIASLTLTTSLTTYSVANNSAWTAAGTATQLSLVVVETAGQGNLDGNEAVWIEFVRLFADDEYPGDFEIPLIGLNVTTDEGTGNSSLNAYPFNSTHYVLRPAFTTNDGDSWRSWNLESDYQDYAQMQGEWGADGWEFLEGKDGWEEGEGIDFTTTGFERGLWNGTITINEAFVNIIVDIDAGADLAVYDSVDIKIRSNASIIKHNLVGYWDGDFKTMNSTDVNINGSWQIINIPYTRTETTLKLGITLKDEVGNFEGDETVFIDYVKLLTTTDTDDLTFYSYETYYRAEMEFNLRRSELSFLALDDTEDDLAEEVVGEFSIASYFGADELIPDVFLGRVGAIDYLFAARSAGANATISWDYYEAEFRKLDWKPSVVFPATAVNDTWEGDSEFVGWNEFSGNENVALQTGYEITVPEFDSCSARMSIHEEGANILGGLIFVVESVNAATGVRTLELYLVITGARSQPFFAGADSQHELSVLYGAVTKYYWFEDNRDNEATFAVNYDKREQELSLQVNFLSNRTVGGEAITVSFTEEVANTGNEFVLHIGYSALGADGFGGGIPGTDEEVNMALDEFSLTSRDLFGDIKKGAGDIVGGVTGGGGGILGSLDFLLEPLTAILNGILAIPGALANVVTAIGEVVTSLASILDVMNLVKGVLDTVSSTLTTISNAVDGLEGLIGTLTTAVNTIGTSITNAVNAIGTTISNAVSAIGTLITNAIEAMELVIETAIESLEDAVDLVTDAVDLVTAAIVALAGQIVTAITDAIGDIVDDILDLLGTIWTAIVTFIRDQSIQGVSVGSVFDVIFSYIGLFTATAATTLAFLLMIVTEWSLIFMVFLFLGILFFAISSSNAPGEVFGHVFRAYKVNTLPFSVLGFRIHVPLAAWNLPFLAIVVLGIA